MINSVAFGQYIRDLRTAKNITQQQLCDQMYVSRKTIGNWESGTSLPDISMLSRLANLLGVETWELVEQMAGTDAPPVVIVVESKPPILKSFSQLLIDALPEAQVYGFDSAAETVNFAAGNRVSVAFINVELGEQDGTLLATALTGIFPRTNIIFISRNFDRSGLAWQLHASGYLLLPLTKSKIRQELQHLRFPVPGLSPKSAEMQEH